MSKLIKNPTMTRDANFRNMQFGLMWTPAVKWLIIINTAIYIAQELLPIHTWNIFDWVGLVPWAVWHDGWVWQFVTYMFFHGGVWHLVFNMLALWMFGSMMERTWGTRRFLRYYFLTGVGAGLSTFLFTLGSTTPTIGASGAIYGLLVAYAVTFPEHTIYLYFFIPIKAKYFALLFGLIEFIASISYSGDSIGHIAHLGGMVVGFVYLKRQNLWMGVESRLRKFLDRLQEQRRRREERETENIRLHIDQLLDKINRVGYQNLTRKERKILDQGSAHLRQKEKTR